MGKKHPRQKKDLIHFRYSDITGSEDSGAERKLVGIECT